MALFKSIYLKMVPVCLAFIMKSGQVLLDGQTECFTQVLGKLRDLYQLVQSR